MMFGYEQHISITITKVLVNYDAFGDATIYLKTNLPDPVLEDLNLHIHFSLPADKVKDYLENVMQVGEELVERVDDGFCMSEEDQARMDAFFTSTKPGSVEKELQIKDP